MLSLGSAAVWAVAVILFKRSGETFSPIALNLYKNVLTIVAMALTIAVFGDLRLPTFSLGQWGLLVASGVLGIAMADTLYFKALNTIGASRTGISASLYSPTVVILSLWFLGETFAPRQILGLGLVVAAVVLISYKPDARDVEPGQLIRGVGLAVAGVVLMALGVVMIKRLLEVGDFLWIVQIRIIAGALGLLALLVWRADLARVWREYRRPHHWGAATVASLLGTWLALLMWLGGYKYTDASIASVLNETASVFIVLLAWWWLDETLDARRIIGVCMSFGGVLLVIS